MANAPVLYQLRAQSSYERDGFNRAVAEHARWAGQNSEMPDNLIVSRTAVNAKADVVAAGTARIYMISGASPAGATLVGYLQIFNAAAAAVTLGTTPPEFQFRIEAGVTRTINFYDSADGVTLPTALSWAVTTTPSGLTAAAAGNTPTITILYRP